MATLTIIRGVSGSGKSTLAHQLSSVTGAKVVEADQFFMKNGIYCFDSTKLSEAHQWCQDMVKQLLSEGYDVIVANTFTRHIEYAPYTQLSLNILGKDPVVYICQNNFPDVHNVPPSVKENQRRRFEY